MRIIDLSVGSAGGIEAEKEEGRYREREWARVGARLGARVR